MDDKTPSSATTEWYTEYYRKQGADRNDLLRNPGVLFQTVAYDVSVIRALRHVVADPRSTSVLDVGCGSGGKHLELVETWFRTRAHLRD
jgi:SAM-dependent methyltransferase